MTFQKLGAAMLTGALIAGGAATASLAQQPSAPPTAQRGEMRPQLTPEQRAERRAERLRAALQLRPEQEPALRAFLQAAQPSQADRQRMKAERQQWASLTTPERLDRQRAAMAERMKRFETRAAATKRFYAQLTPDQQKAFDALGPRGHGEGRRGGRGPGPMGHHRG